MNGAPFVSTATRVLPELLLFDNSYQGYSFPRHFHETYLVELVEAGSEKFYCNGSYYSNIQQDTLVLINPGEIHTGGDNSHRAGFRCKVFYPALTAWQDIAGESFAKNCQPYSPRFTSPICHDPVIVACFKELVKVAATRDNELQVNELYQQLMLDLLHRHMQAPVLLNEIVEPYTEPVKRSLEYINENLSQKLLLEDIARSAFVSPFHFLRMFKRTMGMTLHQYVLALRIDKAKQHLIQKGASIENTFQQVGFSDQSHFTKVFRKMTGLTPKQYKAIAKN